MNGLPPAPAEQPRDLGATEGLAVAALTLVVVLAVFVIVAAARYVGVLDELIEGGSPGPGEADDARDLVDAATVAFSLAVFPLGPAAFLPWFHRAYANLGRMGVRGLRFTPGWAVGAWFIPILNLFRPKQIADDLHRATDGGSLHSVGNPGAGPVSPLLHWWWALFLASAFIGIGGAQYLSDDNPFSETLTFDSLTDERAFYIWQIVTAAVTIMAAVLAVLVVRRVTRDQRAVMAQAAANRDASVPPRDES